MSLRRVLDASPEGRTVRIGPKIYELEVIFVLPPKGNAGHSPPDCIDVELDRPVAERHVFEYRIAAIHSHQAVKKTQFPEEFRVLLRLPVVICHADRDRFRAPANRKC